MKNNTVKTKNLTKAMFLIGLMSAMSISLGWLGTIFSYPYANFIFSIGFVSFNILFIPFWLYHQFNFKENTSKIKEALVILGIFSGLMTSIGVLFKVMHFSGTEIFLISGMIIFSLGFLPLLFYFLYKKAY